MKTDSVSGWGAFSLFRALWLSTAFILRRVVSVLQRRGLAVRVSRPARGTAFKKEYAQRM